MQEMLTRQVWASSIIGVLLLMLIIRLVRKGRLDIAYCWLWLGIGAGVLLVVIRYNWLLWLSGLIGSRTPTTTLFLLGILVVLLMSLQFSLVISNQRRQIKKLTQRLAIMTPEPAVGGEETGPPKP